MLIQLDALQTLDFSPSTSCNERTLAMPKTLHRLPAALSPEVAVWIDGHPAQARAGDTVLTAVLEHRAALQRDELSARPRAGFCLMGACQDCWVRLHGVQRVRACSTLVAPGMRIDTSLAQGTPA